MLLRVPGRIGRSPLQFAFTPAKRVGPFFSWRFGHNPDNLSAAFEDLTQGWGPNSSLVGNLSQDAMLTAANANSMPPPSAADVLGLTFWGGPLQQCSPRLPRE